MRRYELENEIKIYERELADGGETAILGDFVADLDQRKIGESDEVPDTVSAWWLMAYEKYLKSKDSVTDLQSFYDSILLGDTL